jgi:hypothetical protein
MSFIQVKVPNDSKKIWEEKQKEKRYKKRK